MDPDAGPSWHPSRWSWATAREQIRGSPRPVVALAAVAVPVVVIGVLLVSARAEPVVPLEAQMPAVGDVEMPATPSAEMQVHVAGAVVTPGLYRVGADARVADVVEAAGGFTPDAHPDAVNLAEPVTDGTQVYVPSGDEVDGAGGAAAARPGARGVAADGRVDINTAGVAELETLPGIGPSRAAAIIEHREAHGPFASVDALADVPGIGPATVDGLRDAVRE